MKIIFEILLAGAVASLAATACGDMDSIHEQYSGRPEKIYIGRVDSDDAELVYEFGPQD